MSGCSCVHHQEPACLWLQLTACAARRWHRLALDNERALTAGLAVLDDGEVVLRHVDPVQQPVPTDARLASQAAPGRALLDRGKAWHGVQASH